MNKMHVHDELVEMWEQHNHSKVYFPLPPDGVLSNLQIIITCIQIITHDSIMNFAYFGLIAFNIQWQRVGNTNHGNVSIIQE